MSVTGAKKKGSNHLCVCACLGGFSNEQRKETAPLINITMIFVSIQKYIGICIHCSSLLSPES